MNIEAGQRMVSRQPTPWNVWEYRKYYKLIKVFVPDAVCVKRPGLCLQCPDPQTAFEVARKLVAAGSRIISFVDYNPVELIETVKLARPAIKVPLMVKLPPYPDAEYQSTTSHVAE